GPDFGAREVADVRRIRELLGLERIAGKAAVGQTALADHGLVEIAAGVELDAGLGGAELETAAGGRVDDAGAGAKPEAGTVQAPVVIIAAADEIAGADVRQRVDVGADRLRRAEVEGGTGDRQDLA